MKQLNTIGLETVACKQIAEKLNVLLANYQLFYINTRGFHWNISGDKFFELHVKFEELYNDALLKVDEIAERILTLGEVPLHAYKDYLKIAEIKAATNISEGKKAIQNILESFGILIAVEREILKISDKANDEGTNAMMSDYIREQEKLVWMYRAALGK